MHQQEVQVTNRQLMAVLEQIAELKKKMTVKVVVGYFLCFRIHYQMDVSCNIRIVTPPD